MDVNIYKHSQYNTIMEKQTYEKSILLEVIGDTVENRIIDFLIEGRGLDYSKKDIAEGCDISRPTVYKVLPRLIKESIVKEQRMIGRIALYALNLTNERVKALVRLEETLLKDSMNSMTGEKINSIARAKSYLPAPAAV